MKRAVAFIITVIMTLSLCLSVSAAPGGFIESPSGSASPTLDGFTVITENCNGEIVVTLYADRETLSAEGLETIEAAYDQIVANTDLTALNAELGTVAAKLGIDAADLAVSDLFDVSYIGCDTHEGHAGFKITLKAKSLDKFVALLHLNGNKWEMVDDAAVNGDKLSFTADIFSPFAIVVNTAEADDPGTDAPPTGDDSSLIVYSMIILACAAVILVILKKTKRHEA